MELPFTPAQFFEIFSRYNVSVWPMAVAAILSVIFTIVRDRRVRSVTSKI